MLKETFNPFIVNTSTVTHLSFRILKGHRHEGPKIFVTHNEESSVNINRYIPALLNRPVPLTSHLCRFTTLINTFINTTKPLEIDSPSLI